MNTIEKHRNNLQSDEEVNIAASTEEEQYGWGEDDCALITVYACRYLVY